MEVGPIRPGQPREASRREAEEDEKLRKISREFEAIFLSLMMKSMRTSVSEGGLLPRSAGHDLYRQIFDEEIARSAAKGRGIGLADVIYRELSSGRQKTPPSREPGQGILLRGLSPSEEGR